MAQPVPHLAVPFQLNPDGTARTVAQDSLDDVTQCVAVLCATVAGSRVELPAYGIPDQTFAQNPSAALLEQAIATWEPRAQVTVTVAAPPTEQARLNVAVTVAPTS